MCERSYQCVKAPTNVWKVLPMCKWSYQFVKGPTNVWKVLSMCKRSYQCVYSLRWWSWYWSTCWQTFNQAKHYDACQLSSLDRLTPELAACCFFPQFHGFTPELAILEFICLEGYTICSENILEWNVCSSRACSFFGKDNSIWRVPILRPFRMLLLY